METDSTAGSIPYTHMHTHILTSHLINYIHDYKCDIHKLLWRPNTIIQTKFLMWLARHPLTRKHIHTLKLHKFNTSVITKTHPSFRKYKTTTTRYTYNLCKKHEPHPTTLHIRKVLECNPMNRLHSMMEH